MEKAVSLHEQALSLATDDAESAEAHEALGDDHEALFHMDEAVASYLQAVDAARRAGDDPQIIGRLSAKLATAAKRWGAFKQPPPHEMIRTLVDESLGRDVGDRVRADLLIGLGILGGGRPGSSSRAPIASQDRKALPKYIAAVEEGLAIAQRLDDPVLAYRAYETLALLYWHAGDFGRYREVNEREGELLERLPSRRERVDVLVAISSARSEAGRYREALEAAEQAFEQAAELSPHERMHASFYLMWAAQALGQWDRVLEVLPWHLEAAAAEPDVNCPNVRGGPPLGGTLLAWQGRVEEALQLVPVDESAADRDTMFDRALQARYAILVGRADLASTIADRMGADSDRDTYPEGLEAFLEALTQLGRWSEVEELLPAARTMSVALPVLAPTADRAEGMLLIERGQPAEARPLVEAALARFEELAIPFEVARTRELLATVAEASEREAILQPALETYERLGAKPFADRVRAILAAPV